MKDLNNKVAVVTGAGSGIGRSLAKSLAARGCRLALSDVNEAGLAETAAGLDGAEVKTYRLDVSDRDAIYAHAAQVRKDLAHFGHFGRRGLGYRWGMGIDASETRLCEYRCLNLWDDLNNWAVETSTKVKFLEGISESRSDIGHRGKPPYDDTYGMSPVNYVKLDSVPTVDDMSPIIDALKRGDYFVTSGEVLIPSYSVTGVGDARIISAEVEWTFPLDFVEVVFGDGERTTVRKVSATDLPAFGSKSFRIPFDATGQAWVRFAAWDSAGNGAMTMPVRLNNP